MPMRAILAIRYLALAAALLVSASQPAAAQLSLAVELNNAGVRWLNAGYFESAIEQFEAALRVDPSYSVARENLAIAYNNYGLRLKDKPKEAIKQFHRALFCNPDNATTKENLEGIIRLMGKNPQSFDDRVALGEEAQATADLKGASIEFEAALSIRKDPAVSAKLAAIKPLIASEPSTERQRRSHQHGVQWKIAQRWKAEHKSIHAPILKLKLGKDGTLADVSISQTSGDAALDKEAADLARKCAPFDHPPEGVGEFTVDPNSFVDFGPYMAELNRRIKAAWLPPSGFESKRITVLFKLNKGGELSHLVVLQSSGEDSADKAALEAVKQATPFKPLPKGAPDEVDITFTFDRDKRSGN